MRFPGRKICMGISIFAMMLLMLVVMSTGRVVGNDKSDCSCDIENMLNEEKDLNFSDYKVGLSIGNDLSIRL